MMFKGMWLVVMLSALVCGAARAGEESSEAGSWTVSVVDPAQVGERTSIAYGRDGSVHIAYYEFVTTTSRRLKYARHASSGWSVETVDESTDVGMPSLALDPAGEPSISYFDYSHQSLKLARHRAGGWQVSVVDGEESVGVDSSLAIDRHGRPHISYYDLTNKHLKYARFTGTSWAIQTVDDGIDVGEDTSLALDDAGHPHIAYLDKASQHLKYAAWDGHSWDIATVDRNRKVGYGASLCLWQGAPRIAYFDLAKERLKLASLNGGSWTLETIVAAPAGSRVSLAIDLRGELHLGMYLPGDNARHARKNPMGGSWSFDRVETASAPGFATSLALDPAGNPHLAFADPVKRALKYASPVRLALAAR